MRRYHYTPRRDGRQSRNSGSASNGGESRSILPFALPALVLPALVLAIVWLTSGSGGATCNGAKCDSALAMGSAPAPTVRAATASPRARHSPGPPPQVRGLSAAILEAPCGRTVYASTSTRPTSRRLTKMMTALVAANHETCRSASLRDRRWPALSRHGRDCDRTDRRLADDSAGPSIRLLLRSGNDAALAIASRSAAASPASSR